MSTENIKDVVKEKYGQAARRVSAGTSCCASAVVPEGYCDAITSNLYDSSQTGQTPRGSSSSLAGVWESHRCWPSLKKAKPFWIWAPEAVSMYSCLLSGWGRLARRTAWI